MSPGQNEAVGAGVRLSFCVVLGLTLELVHAWDNPANAQEAGLAVGETAPGFTLKTMNPKLCGRQSAALAEFVGAKAKSPTKAVFLSFAASYCAPCRVEWTQLAKRHAELKQAGVELLGVVVDREEAGQIEMAKFVETEIEAPFPVLLDRFGILSRRYRASALPYALLIDGASGTITEVHVGYEERVLSALLTKLTGARSTPP